MFQTMEDIIRRFYAYGMEYKDHEGEITPLVKEGWNPLFPVDHLKKYLLTTHPTAKEFHNIWNQTFKEGEQVLVSTLGFNNLKGSKKMRDAFVGPFTIIKLVGKNGVEVRFTEEFSRKHPVFPVSLVKQYFWKQEDKFPSRKKK
ncbi:hypothetical protein O181_125265 [Austropuccinia psidii MF-1]|uniref:Tf2-1-like SH3-like domain-containing protein n=1 Tax=Austropuccinia psidii MF-1 TaxID=1389203 RepID=A0A9Q3KUJ1_9BASI|nr:hypothetical protein [Austropuccinia psidii MF-1]